MRYVDYAQVAAAYQEGRRDIARAEDWGQRAVQFVSDQRNLRVLDLGAGSGIFARAWPGWGASLVLAVDPTVTMCSRHAIRELGLQYSSSPDEES